MIIDTHAHLFFDDIKKDINEVVERALEQGVVKIIVPALDLKTSEEILKLSEEHDIIYAAIGLHPSDIKDANIKDIKTLEKLTEHEKVVAIGEIGLDYYWNKDNMTEQRSFFREQLELAKDKTLPVIIHTRNSIKDALQIIGDASDDRLKGQFHCFSGDDNNMKEVIKLNDFYVSFCGNITFKNFKYKELIENTPVEKLLSETDSPFLTPEPFRGKRNEPSRIVYTIKKMAEIKNMNYDELLKTLYDNAQRLFFEKSDL